MNITACLKIRYSSPAVRALFPGLLTLAALLICAGCDSTDPTKGYTNRSLFYEDIETIFIPQFQNETFYRTIDYDLTAAVARRIEQESGYKVISSGSRADSTLYGIIEKVDKTVANQQRDLDRPLENRVTLYVRVTWKDERSGEYLIDNKTYPVNMFYAAMKDLEKTSVFREIIDEMAIRIVEDMEKPW